MKRFFSCTVLLFAALNAAAQHSDETCFIKTAAKVSGKNTIVTKQYFIYRKNSNSELRITKAHYNTEMYKAYKGHIPEDQEYAASGLLSSSVGNTRVKADKLFFDAGGTTTIFTITFAADKKHILKLQDNATKAVFTKGPCPVELSDDSLNFPGQGGAGSPMPSPPPAN